MSFLLNIVLDISRINSIIEKPLNHNIPLSNRNYSIVNNATKEISFRRINTNFSKALSLPCMLAQDLNALQEETKIEKMKTGNDKINNQSFVE